MEPTGYLAVILHAHLPFVRHPHTEGMLEERWLYEAITDCYLPLLEVLSGWDRDGVPGRLTMSLTPPLVSMLDDELLRSRYRAFMDRQSELADREVDRTRSDPPLARVAEMYRGRLERLADQYHNAWGGDIVGAFRGFAARGRIELLASGATHGYLPLLGLSRAGARAQVSIGVDSYHQRFGWRPQGFWLPECGYSPGDEELLAASGIRYFTAETHALLHASVRPKYGVYAPVYCPSGVAAFGRDIETSRQVWSSVEGYPGDYWYREYYRDIGHDQDIDYLEPYLPPGPIRTHTGFKYYRVTGPGGHKEPYDPDRARERVMVHADNFVFNRRLQVEHLCSIMDRPPVITAPYDAELFGHWWFEGPDWLDRVFRNLAADDRIEAITPGDYLARFRRNQVTAPSLSSWGYRGFSEVWLEGSNDWVWRHLHLANDRMAELSERYSHSVGIRRRALNQAAREVLLASASDWPFIMQSGTVAGYARSRVEQHVTAFGRLRDQLLSGQFDEGYISELEQQNNLFPDIDCRRFISSAASRTAPDWAAR